MNSVWRLPLALLVAIGLIVNSTRADNRVLIIGIDGAGGRYLSAANTPAIDTLIAGGSARFDFFNEGALVRVPPGGYGASGVNWSTITTGTSAAHHGVVDNSFSGSKFNLFPHFFKHIKAADPTKYTASIVNWEPINSQILANQYANLEQNSSSDTTVRNLVVNQLNFGDPDAIFVHFDQVDAAGHSIGWGSPQYYTAIQNVDSLIGSIMLSLNARPGVVSGAENWLVMITADHGGQGLGHDASQGLINWEVPFVISGPAVVDGIQLPQGTLRDIVPTALWHLGIDPFALGLDGTVRGLTVTPPNGVIADLNQDGVVAGDGTGPSPTDDVTTFISGWLAKGAGGIVARYARGDINLDGITDLSDWAILNRENPAVGAAAMDQLGRVPEPEPLVSLLLVAQLAAILNLRAPRETQVV
jgi:predicted AlkP superfamily pyrophosphatase or phosphodiesterase